MKLSLRNHGDGKIGLAKKQNTSEILSVLESGDHLKHVESKS